jgi:hypothetical protein
MRPYYSTSCDTALFAGFAAPPGRVLDCTKVWQNLDAVEDLIVYEHAFLYPFEFRRLFASTRVFMWETEAGLRAQCGITDRYRRLYGCWDPGGRIHLDSDGRALLHEMLHVVAGPSHDGWNTNGFDVAALKYWLFRHQSPLVPEPEEEP